MQIISSQERLSAEEIEVTLKVGKRRLVLVDVVTKVWVKCV